ncbi:MAG TPA: fumarate hydratase C-terminal domain-containing protein, partial [Caldilineaceae bacterium]|nr:fumarate hydratase C-terminal domain-containing protein [Caldilineaceae bacterium]
ALVAQRAVYAAAGGGAAALLGRHIHSSRVVAWPELGTEAIHELTVEGFPAIVINDCHGGDAYVDGRGKWMMG